ncbi:MAG: apolipoprotein N-acyltransferase [Kiritimatiellia bacterium]
MTEVPSSRDSFRRLLAHGWRAAAAVASGVLLARSFPPTSDAGCAWGALIPLLIVTRFSTPFQAAAWGFLTGLLFWLISLSWLLRLGATGAPWPLAVLAWVALSAYCAIYIALFALLVAKLWSRKSSAPITGDAGAGRQDPLAIVSALRDLGYVLGIPLLWVGFEYLRSTLFTGFPWNAFGVSQYRNLPVIQIAEWGGVYAVSALVVMFNTAFTRVLLRMFEPRPLDRRWQFQFELAVALALILLAWVYGLSVFRSQRNAPPDGTRLKLAAVQPNIPQLKKWTPEFASEIYRTLEKHTDFVLRSSNTVDLIVWPETAVPAPILSDREAYDLVMRFGSRGVPLLVGSMEAVSRGREQSFYNSSFLFDGNGRLVDRYRKRHLVPFGEYIPLSTFIPILKYLAPLGFNCDAGDRITLFPLRDCFFFVLICFEDTIPHLARSAVRAGARLLVNQTNDAWFDPSAGSVQHVSHCVFRCVENRVPAFRVANTGVTCLITPLGAIHTAGASEGNGSDTGDFWGRCIGTNLISTVIVPDVTMSPTFYTRYGDLPFALPCGVAALGATAWYARAAWGAWRKHLRNKAEGRTT